MAGSSKRVRSGGRDGMNGHDGRDGRDVVPRPDPTAQTKVLVDDAVSGLARVIDERVKGLEKNYETRLDAAAEAVKLQQTILDRLPVEMDVKVGTLQALHGEKFSSVQTQFKERDTRGTEQTRSGESALKAALDAAKDAVNLQTEASALATAKSEAATTKQMDQLGIQIQTETRALDRTIGDLKERITRIEGMGVGTITEKSDARQASGISMNQVGMYISIIAVLVLLAEKVFTR